MPKRPLSAALTGCLLLLTCSTAFAYYSKDSYEGDVAFTGMVDTRAPNGAWGTLLLDPADYYIDAVGGPTRPAGDGPAPVLSRAERGRRPAAAGGPGRRPPR